MASIFISYRRDDSEDVAGRIYDELIKHFPSDDVFMDVDSIPDGADFVQVIQDKVRECQVMLVVIGRNWVGHLPAQRKRRIDNAEDFVRLEVEAALRRGMPVIPLLVSRATMPSPADLPPTLARLAVLNARPIRSRDFHFDMEELVAAIEMQRATWLALETERAQQQRQREQQELQQARQQAEAERASPTHLQAEPATSASALGVIAPFSERQLLNLAGASARYFMSALRNAIGRALVAFVIVAALAVGGTIGASLLLVRQTPIGLPTYVAAGWSALSAGAFAGLFVVFEEVMRALIRALELILEESERAQRQAFMEVEVLRRGFEADALRLGRASLSDLELGAVGRSIITESGARLPGHHALQQNESSAGTSSSPTSTPPAHEASKLADQVRRDLEERYRSAPTQANDTPERQGNEDRHEP